MGSVFEAAAAGIAADEKKLSARAMDGAGRQHAASLPKGTNTAMVASSDFCDPSIFPLPSLLPEFDDFDPFLNFGSFFSLFRPSPSNRPSTNDYELLILRAT